MTNKVNKLKYLSPIVTVVFFQGCGSGESIIPTYTPPNFGTEQTGYLIDSPVQGIDYYCGDLTGVTDSDGKFTYNTFKCMSGVEFKIGSLSLGTILPGFIKNTSDKYLTIQELAGMPTSRNVIINKENVMRLAVLLQSLDNDGNPDNGILITQNIKNQFAGSSTLLLKNMTDRDVSTLIAMVGKTEKDKYTALSHLLNYTKSIDSSITATITPIFQSGETWKGKEYRTITSPVTQRVWLDRNLGSSQVCTSSADTDCYGDYYQWGRDADGHQLSNSTTITTLAIDLNTTGNNKFIKNSTSPFDWIASGVDDNGSLRSANWSKTDGTSVCPIGYRVPTIEELNVENILNSADAFNKLKLPSAGARFNNTGTIYGQNSFGSIWSSVFNGFGSNPLYFDSSEMSIGYVNRAEGLTIRCIRD